MHRRYFAEDLIRLRRADEQRRYLASQRSGRVDPNPHQIDAVIFALQRIPEGGCILADEVGLGKTIEAGLVIAQLRAEGAARILLVTPKPLLGQWQQELHALFGIETREVRADESSCEGPGVFIVGRELAGSERGARMLQASGSFDLCVIDEAHEVFAGIHRRYDRRGGLRDDAPQARMAGRVKAMLTGTPVLLLTATPIQNTLTELWGLVQYVEPTGTLLGDLGTFRAVFCRDDDRVVAEGQEEELRTRIAQVCRRTLRRQAQAYMERKFMRRVARLFEYTMSPEEKTLYDDVTAYLLEPDLCAFRGNFRRLLVIGFHRRMASSIRALAASLENVAARLRRQIGGEDEDTLHLFEDDLEEDPDVRPEDRDEGAPPGTQKLRAELARVERFIERAKALPGDSKAEALLEAVRFIRRRAQAGEGSGKLVVFTEALSTQDYLRELLVASGLVGEEDVTIFRGSNEGPRVRQALERWHQEVGGRASGGRGEASRSVAVRLALVHEFETRSSIFIATEAGAKGLNLQFCENVVNYDLPWNPQRIEQRIGRCHRYGQRRDVTVINFLARDNAAQRLTFEILSRKLELFGTVLDASDAILYEPTARSPEALVGALGLDVEARLRKIYEQARTTEEIEAGLQAADVAVGEARVRFEHTHARTHGLIETRLDETVRAAFRRLSDELPEGLATFDRDLEGVLKRWLEAIDCPHACTETKTEESGRTVRYAIAACPRLPEAYREGIAVQIGPQGSTQDAEPLHLGHPLLRAAVEEARRATREPFTVRLRSEPGSAAARWAGRRGWMHVLEIHHGGFDPVVRLLPVALLEGEVQPLHGDDALTLFLSPADDVEALEPPLRIDPEAMQDALEEAMFLAQADDDAHEQTRFEETLERLERFMADRVLVLVRQRAELEARREEAVQRRDGAVGSQARSRAEAELVRLDLDLERHDAEIDRLRSRDDEDYELWRLRAYQRRYTPPRWKSMLELRFEVPPETPS